MQRFLLYGTGLLMVFVCVTITHGDIGIAEDDNRLIVTAGDRGDDPFFSLTWNLAAGGELSDVQIFDTEEMVPLIKGPLPGWKIVTADGVEYRIANDENAELKIFKRTGDHVVFSITAQPTADDGKQLPMRIKQRYTVYDVGSVFCEFTVSTMDNHELSGAAKPVTLRSVDIALPLSAKSWDAIEWEVKGPDIKTTYDGEWYPLCDDLSQFSGLPLWSHPYRPVGSAALGRKGRFSNHVEFWMNHGRPISGKHVENLWAKGRYGVLEGVNGVFVNLLPKSTVLKPGYQYKNAWVLDLGKVVQWGPAIGMRVYDMALSTTAGGIPSQEWLTYLHQAKGNVVKAHASVDHTYLRSDYNDLRMTSLTEAKLKKALAAMPKLDMRIAMYAGSGHVEPFTNDDLIARRAFMKTKVRWNVDGLYTDQAYIPEGDLHATFKRLRELRQAVGDQGLWLSHQGPTQAALWSKYVDMLCTGEAYHMSEQRESTYQLRWPILYDTKPLFGRIPESSYYGRQGVAYCAGSGAIPGANMGYNPWQGEGNPLRQDSEHAHTVVLYQIRAAAPLEKAKLYHADTVPVTRSTTKGFLTATYRISPDLILFVTTNFDAKSPDSVITIDRKRLGMTGDYKTVVISGDDFWNMKATELRAETYDKITITGLKQYDIVGHVLYRGTMPAQLRETIDEIQNRDPKEWAVIDYNTMPELVDYPARVQRFGLISKRPMKQVWARTRFAKADSDVCVKIERTTAGVKGKKLLGFVVASQCPVECRPSKKLILSPTQDGWVRIDSGKPSGLASYTLSTVSRVHGPAIFTPIVEIADLPSKESIRLTIDLTDLQTREYGGKVLKMKTCDFVVSDKPVRNVVANGGFEGTGQWKLSQRGKMLGWFQLPGFTSNNALEGKKAFSLGYLVAKPRWTRSEKLRKAHVRQAVEMVQTMSVTPGKPVLVQFDFQFLFKNSERLYLELDGKRVWDNTDMNFPRKWLRESVVFIPRKKTLTVRIGQEGIEPRLPRWPRVGWYTKVERKRLKNKNKWALIDAVKVYQ